MDNDTIDQAINLLCLTQAELARELGWADQSGLKHMRNGRYKMTEEKQQLLVELMRARSREISYWLDRYDVNEPRAS